MTQTKTKWLRLLVVASLGAALPVVAMAEGVAKEEKKTEMQQPMQQGIQQPAQQGVFAPLASNTNNSQYVRDAAASGFIQGVVSGLSYPNGIVTVNSGNLRVSLHGTPGQLASLKRGDSVSLPYSSYAGVLWLGPQFAESVGGTQGSLTGAQATLGFAQSGVVSGVVQGIDKARGQLVISGPQGTQRFLAHPETIEALVPGEFINLAYMQVGGVPWLDSVHIYAPGAPTNIGAMQQPANTGGSNTPAEPQQPNQ